VSEQHF